MKQSVLLLAWLSSCQAFVVPLAGRNASRDLEPRMNTQQQLIDPDNEGTYTDPVTGSQVQKSRILTGVGPEAADNRLFDWDESCSDAGQRAKILAAWENFQDLTTRASTQLRTLRASLPSPPATIGRPNPENQAKIVQVDPAYTQYFKARDIGLQWVQDSFARITDNVRNYPNRGNVPALRFICSADDHVKTGNGESFCGRAHAETMVPQGPADTGIEQRYRFHQSSSIIFCPPFFDDTQLPNINVLIANNDPSAFTLDKLDCRERVMLHEYMHVPWVRNMNPGQDVVGWLAAARAVTTLSWGSIRSTPDCYAWYAIYSFFNNDHQGCGADVWPKGVQKPVRINTGS